MIRQDFRFDTGAMMATRPICATMLFVLLSATLPAQEADGPAGDTDEELTRARLELMQQYVGQFRCTSDEADFPDRFEPEPIFQYADPVREYSTAALWRLGAEGRPRAILATECRLRIGGGPGILFEYLSLTETPFAISSAVQAWSPRTSALEFKPVPGAPAPTDLPERRLIQMRNFARSFEAAETLGGQRNPLRLLSSPILRYQQTAAVRADGALFLYVFGTNPEIALFIESDGSEWSFAAGRLTTARQMSLTLNGQSAWQAPAADLGPSRSYHTSPVNVAIPGVKP